MIFRIKGDKKGKISEYNITINKVKYKFYPWIRIELNGNIVKLVNAFTGVNHLFENGKTEVELEEKELRLFMKKIEKEFRVA